MPLKKNMSISERIFWTLYDMDNTQDYPSIDEITKQLTTEKGRAYLLESLFE